MNQYSYNFTASVWEVFGLAGLLVLAAVGLAFLLFRFLGSKWIEGKFAKDLEDYKGLQQRQLEDAKMRFNALLDRTTKLHVIEFQVLPELWALVVEAVERTRGLSFSLRSISDLNRLSDDDARKVLSRHFPSDDIEHIITAPDKMKEYSRAIDIDEYNKANQCFEKLRIYSRQKEIFIRDDIKEKIRKIETLTLETLVEREMNIRYELDKRERTKALELMSNGAALLDDLSGSIRLRLWSAHDTAAA